MPLMSATAEEEEQRGHKRLGKRAHVLISSDDLDETENSCLVAAVGYLRRRRCGRTAGGSEPPAA